ncbi:flavin monoamine oxidase family protein [Nakamurella sp.]|uniref:flavin monoamine oxidase family protein n=1 Tax=Nakamurella sp. TaxID=1869182 RepID=UPI00378477FC
MGVSEVDVIVVGAGLAGLTAARDLTAAGVGVVTLEARSRVGGRAWTDPTALHGNGFEMGGMFVDPAHTAIVTELDRYGLSLEPLPFPASVAWLTLGELRRGGLPVPPDELPQLEIAVRAWQDAAATADGGGFVPGSVAHFFTSRVHGPHTLDLLRAYFDTEVSGDWATASMHTMAEDLAGGGGSVTRWTVAAMLAPTVQGGISELTAALGAEAGRIELDSPVRSLTDDGTGVDVSITDGRSYRAGAVILATPLNTWPDLEVSPAWTADAAALIARGHRGSGAKLGVLARGDIPDVAFCGLPNLSVLKTIRRLPDGAVVLVVFGSHPDQIDPDDLAAVADLIRPVVPDVQVLAAAMHDWVADPYARGTWLAHDAATTTAEVDAVSVPHGRIVPAGADVTRVGASYLDGAVHSGRAAARLAVSLLGT